MSSSSFNKDDGEKIVWTPFYRTIPDVKTTGWVDEPDFNYTSYDIFVLNTKLSYWLKHNFGPKLSISYPSARGREGKSNSMYITVVPTKGGEVYDMSSDQVESLQHIVDEITTSSRTAVLLMSIDSYPTEDPFGDSVIIPSDWLRSIYPYVGLSPDVNPHMSEMGIMVELESYIDFSSVYFDLVIQVIERVKNLYFQGYIVNPDPDIIEKWGLISLNADDSEDNGMNTETKNKIYKTSWKDSRITSKYGGMYGFLMSRQQGEKTIDLFIGYKSLAKHNLAKYLLNYDISGVFSNQHVSVHVDNIADAQAIASNIDIYANEGSGYILQMTSSRPSWILLYSSIAEKMGYDDTVGYLSTDESRPYVFSCLVPYETNIQEVTKNINMTATEMISRLEDEGNPEIEISLTRQGFSTIHDVIESGEEQFWRQLLQ
jgi:hypothetical protein